MQGGKKRATAKPPHRNARTRKPASKPVKPAPRTGQSGSELVISLTVHIPRELLAQVPEGGEGAEPCDRVPTVKRVRVEGVRGRVNSLSEEDWEERELDDDIFTKVCTDYIITTSLGISLCVCVCLE